jgi:DNA-binding NtrC family response regulator
VRESIGQFEALQHMSANKQPVASAQILVVEDSSVYREMQGLLLRQAGFRAWLFENPQAALAEAAKHRFDLVVIDYELPEMNGEQLMHALRAIQPGIAVVFVSGSLTLELAIKLSQQNVAGIFHKPANPKQLLEKITETLSRAARDTAVRTGSQSPIPAARETPVAATPPPPDQLAYEPRYVLGESTAFREFTHRLWKVRDFRSVLLLQGETGTPFDLFARELAGISLFRSGPVMLCDAAQFEPHHVIEVLAPSLLSHDAGTLILTNVDEFTLEQQATLDQLSTGRGAFLPFARRFRIVIAATERLNERVDEGTFDDTLFYRISSLSLVLPALRDLRGDIAMNAQRLVEQHHGTVDATAPNSLTSEAAAWIEARDWPGNYAELSYFLGLAMRHAHGKELGVDALEAALAEYQTDVPDTSWSTASAPALPAEPAASFETATATAVAEAPPIARANSSSRVLATRSLFRPASNAYNFGKRLADAIASADAYGAA